MVEGLRQGRCIYNLHPHPGILEGATCRALQIGGGICYLESHPIAPLSDDQTNKLPMGAA
jgi:hypothetical protein